MKITRFEDLPVWQRSRELVRLVQMLISMNNAFSRDFALKDQIRRAAISVMSNIAEGYARRSDKAFANFLHISQGSSSEVQSQLFIALDLRYITQAEFDKAYTLAADIGRQTQGLITYLNKPS